MACRLLDRWCEFVQSKADVRVINEDQWRQVGREKSRTGAGPCRGVLMQGGVHAEGIHVV